MKVLHKFVIKSYLGPMFLTFFIVLFIFLIQFLWVYIDEMVGKGISWSVLVEFMGWMLLTFIPMALPLSTLFASIMTMGNLGENNELLALKAAGISLRRILNPLIIVIILIAIGGFFGSNNLIPYANFKARSLLYDIKRKPQELIIPEGIFYNGMPGYSIRIQEKNHETQLLKNITIYDHKTDRGNVNVTIADSGYIRQTPDQKHLMLTLYNGNTYEDQLTASGAFRPNKGFNRRTFSEQTVIISLGDIDFERTDDERFKESAMAQNIMELSHSYDSLSKIRNDKGNTFKQQATQTGLIFGNGRELDTAVNQQGRYIYPVNTDSIFTGMSAAQKRDIVKQAKQNSENSTAQIDAFVYENEVLRKKVTNLQIEWHRKFTLSVACILFFFIGAPLGAIIRKGGLGMPVVVSVLFFIIYYVIDITCKKLGQSGSWNPVIATWISTAVLAPAGAFLTYKASTDSALFNTEQYAIFFNKIFGRVSKLIKKIDLDAYPAIEEVAPTDSLVADIQQITTRCNQFNKDYQLNKSLVKSLPKWLLTDTGKELDAIEQQYNYLLANLANIYEERIRENVKQYPVFESKQYRLYQYGTPLRILMFIIFPVGITMYIWELNKRKKLHYVFKEIININNTVELYIKQWKR